MAILVQTIIDRASSALDAEDFNRYDFENDFAPAINYAQEWLVSAYSRVFNENKFSEENLKELLRIRVWKTSIFSRVSMNIVDLGEDVWSIVAVYPEIEYDGTTIPAQPNNKLSVYCKDLSYKKSYKSAKRSTLEKVNINRENPFAHGNEVDVCAGTRTYSYVLFVDYSGSYTASPIWELEIQPNIGQELVAISYLAQPPAITLITESLPFPASLTNILTDKVLEFISRKQGDNTNLKGISDKELAQLLNLTT